MLPALHKVDPSLLEVGKGHFGVQPSVNLVQPTKGMGDSQVGIIPCGNNSWRVFPPFPRLAGGLLPYAPTYSSWLDCWSQLHREVSAEAGMHWHACPVEHREELGLCGPLCGPSTVIFSFQGNMSRGNSLFFRKVPAGKRYVWEERRFR